MLGEGKSLGGGQASMYLGLESTRACRGRDMGGRASSDLEHVFQQWVSHVKHRTGQSSGPEREEESRNKWKFQL